MYSSIDASYIYTPLFAAGFLIMGGDPYAFDTDFSFTDTYAADAYENFGICCVSGIGVYSEGSENIEEDCFVVGPDAGCDGVCFSGAEEDCTGECSGSTVVDCAGVCGGSAVEDCAGVCGGDAVVGGCDNACGSTAVEDCAGTCGGDAVADPCGDCNGDGVACSTVFNVDMNCAGTEFTTVHVTGPFCGWCGGEEWNTMSDEDGDGVYTLTLYNLEAPFEYKYMIDGFADQEILYDDMAAGASCAPVTDYWSFGNRQLDAVGGGLTVSETYGSCMTCDEQAAMLVSTIDFEVDMNGSMYPNADYGHVVLNGDWPGAGPWNGWGLELLDEDGDGVFTGSLTLDVGTSFEYVVAVTGAADGWSGWGQQFGQPACNGANFTATAPADGNTSTTVSILSLIHI